MINLKTKKIKSIKAVVIITAILAVLALIANFLLYADAFKDDQKIYTDQTEYEAKVGESFNLNTKAKTDITYKVKGSINVDKKGNVTCKKEGAGTITIKADRNLDYKPATKKVRVTVTKNAQKITGLEKEYELKIDEELEIAPKAKTKISYKIKDKKIASINKKGVLKGLSDGETKLIITAEETDEYKSAVKTITIKVNSLEERQKKARQAAVAWAINIANDNSFHYGRSKWAHKFGCYYCNTQGAKIKAGASREEAAKTWCCNPFVVAAYVHGAGVDSKCGKGGLSIGLANDGHKNMEAHNFKRVDKPSKITDLEVGDILQTPTHCMLYAGDGKIVDAAHHDNGVKNKYWNESINHHNLNNRQWSRTTKVYRYMGTGKF